MLLNFLEIEDSELGALLFDSYLSAQLVQSPEPRATSLRPTWENQPPETRALWNAFAQRLIALYRDD